MSGSRPSRIASAQSDVRRWQRAAIGARPDTERFATILEDRSSAWLAAANLARAATHFATGTTTSLSDFDRRATIIFAPKRKRPAAVFEAFPAKGCDVDHTWRTLSREQQCNEKGGAKAALSPLQGFDGPMPNQRQAKGFHSRVRFDETPRAVWLGVCARRNGVTLDSLGPAKPVMRR